MKCLILFDGDGCGILLQNKTGPGGNKKAALEVSGLLKDNTSFTLMFEHCLGI